MNGLTSLILTEGCRASACGRVVMANGETWFDPPLPVTVPYYEPGTEPAPRPSGLGIRVEGVDLERLEQRREKHGAVEGWACLTGVWHDQRLSVTEQQGLPAQELPSPKWVLPPCDPPVGGWPIGGVDENIDVHEDLHGPEVVTVSMFRPSPRQVVAVVASVEPELTRRRLGAAVGGRLCVIKSRWTRQQVQEVRARLDEHHEDWLLYLWGEGTDDDGQLQMVVELVRVTAGLADYAAQLPDGLLVVDPWLAPVQD